MENKKYLSTVLIKFLVCSLVGIFLFFVPVSFNGKSTIPLDHIVNLVLKVPYFKEVYGTIVIFGKNGHAEVLGLVGQTHSQAIEIDIVIEIQCLYI